MDKGMLMHRFLTGQATAAEAAELEAWIAADPENAQNMEDMRILYGDAPLQSETEPGDNDERRQAFLARLDRYEAKQKRWRIAGTIAASMLITLVIFVSLVYIWPGAGADRLNADELRLAEDVHFNDVSIGEIIRLLQDDYRFEVRTASPALSQCRFTGSFSGGTSVTDLIEIVAQAKGFNVTYPSDRIVIFSGKGCP
jgi:ferric-dicitrate binding protein FerR (iron transport regulator)